MSFLISWLVLAFAVWVTSKIVTGVRVHSFKGAVVAAAIFGVLNAILGWLLFAVFVGVTLGVGLIFAFLTRWIVDAILLEATDGLTDQIEIEGFGAAFLAALSMSLIGTGGEWLLHQIGWLAG
jgi:putative membrane protein